MTRFSLKRPTTITADRRPLLARTRRGLMSALRSLGSLLPAMRKERASDGRVVRPWREDALHSYPTVGLTPSRALSFLQQADAGSPQMQFELFTEMLQKWPRLAAVEGTRRLALTGLAWEIVPDDRATESRPNRDRQGAETGTNRDRQGAGSGTNRDRQGAETAADAARVADFCRETLARLERFRGTLDHLARAIGLGVSVAELVWEDGKLIDAVPVPHSRLIADVNEPWRLRVRTEDEPSQGVALDEHAAKWIVHTPRPQAGRHFEAGLLRASVLLYVAQSLSFKDWLIYSQIAGMPLRVARFEPGTPEADKRELLRMLEALGSDAVAIFTKNVDLQFVEAPHGSGDRPFEPLQNYCNTEITILWLGQHLTTDISGNGSRAAAEVHDRVREDLLVHDLADEAATLRRDLLTPLVQARFGDGAPVPLFRRSLVESVDTRVLADTLAVAINELGVAVPRRWAHRALGIPEPAEDEAVLVLRRAEADRPEPSRDREGAGSSPRRAGKEAIVSDAHGFPGNRSLTVAARNGRTRERDRSLIAARSGAMPKRSAGLAAPSPASGPLAELTVRPALRGDFKPLSFFFDTALRRDYFIRRGQLEEMLQGPHHQLWVAEIDAVLVGVAVTTAGTRLVNALVHPAYRGLGIGRALVEASGAAEVRVKRDMSSGDPSPFYRSLGFVPTGVVNDKGNIAIARKGA